MNNTKNQDSHVQAKLQAEHVHLLGTFVKLGVAGDSPAIIDLAENTTAQKLVSSEHGQSILSYTIESHHLNQTAQTIIEKARSEQLFKPDRNGKTYLDIAIDAGNEQMAHLLVAKATAKDLEKWNDNPRRSSLETQVRKAPDNDFGDSAHGVSVNFTDLEAQINKKLDAAKCIKPDATKIGNGSTQWTLPEPKSPNRGIYPN